MYLSTRPLHFGDWWLEKHLLKNCKPKQTSTKGHLHMAWMVSCNSNWNNSKFDEPSILATPAYDIFIFSGVTSIYSIGRLFECFMTDNLTSKHHKFVWLPYWSWISNFNHLWHSDSTNLYISFKTPCQNVVIWKLFELWIILLTQGSRSWKL